MKQVTLRLSEDAWTAIQAEAQAAGISASEFVREAIYFRLGYRWARRAPDDEVLARLRQLFPVAAPSDVPPSSSG